MGQKRVPAAPLPFGPQRAEINRPDHDLVPWTRISLSQDPAVSHLSGDVPVRGDFFGTGLMSLAVYRPSTGQWYVKPSNGTTQWNVTFGQSGDVPLTTAATDVPIAVTNTGNLPVTVSFGAPTDPQFGRKAQRTMDFGGAGQGVGLTCHRGRFEQAMRRSSPGTLDVNVVHAEIVATEGTGVLEASWIFSDFLMSAELPAVEFPQSLRISTLEG